jgi:hypothetical protein
MLLWGLAGRLALAEESTERLLPETAALNMQSAIPLPAPPAWNGPGQTPLYSLEDLLTELKRNTRSHPELIYQAQSFVRPDLRWLKAYVKWFAAVEKPLHIGYQDQTFDCDKFSRCFVAFADLLALRSGEARASICVGWVTVNNDQAFGGVEAGNGHALVLVAALEGMFVIEPQSGAMVPLADYPDRDQLKQVNF